MVVHDSPGKICQDKGRKHLFSYLKKENSPPFRRFFDHVMCHVSRGQQRSRQQSAEVSRCGQRPLPCTINDQVKAQKSTVDKEYQEEV